MRLDFFHFIWGAEEELGLPGGGVELMIFEEAALKAAARLGPFDASLHLGYTREGRCVQTTHLGDYAGVEEMCRSLYRDLLPHWGVAPCGPYHEIYLNDPTRVAPEKRRMVVRQPVA